MDVKVKLICHNKKQHYYTDGLDWPTNYKLNILD